MQKIPKHPLTKHPRFSCRAATVLLLALGAPLAQAHPGHSLFDQGFTHTLTSADHLFLLAVIGGGLFCIGRAIQSRRVRQVLQSLGGLLVLAAIALWKLSA